MENPWVEFYEKGVPRTLRYPDTTLPKILFETSRRFPKKPAVKFYGKVITYEELDLLSNRFANALIRLGVQRGDRVALMLPNCPQYLIAFFGVMKTGAIAVQTNPLYVERELEQQLNDADAETLVALDLFYPRIQTIQPKTSVRRIILTRINDFFPPLLRVLYPLKAIQKGEWLKIAVKPPLHEFRRLLDRAETTQPIVPLLGKDTAILQYTGGTTGTPKGVMLSHSNLVANVVQCRNWMPSLREGEEVFLGVIPFFHVYGMTTCLNLSLLIGGCLVLLPRFSTEEVLRTIVKNRVTLFMGVQAMYVAINNHPAIDGYNLSSIRICISGAGPLHVEVQERFEALTGGKLVEGYGLSEASPVTHCTPIHSRRKKGSIGLPFPDTECKVMEAGRPQPPGQVGELYVRGPQVMQGYWKRPEESRDVLVDGWLRTGDMAMMDEDGYFFIVDRKKDMIKTKGENVYPREVEEVLFRYPKVKDAVVVGLPDTFGGEKIKAYIVPKEGETCTEEEIIGYCSNELARFKIPKSVEFRKELPKTMVGKVLRRVLIEQEEGKSGGG
jgi:long-chain acyl-CoA synthetase